MTDLIRAFIAISLPETLVDFMSEVQQKLKVPGLRISWVPPRNVHLTIKFLGDIAPVDIDPIVTVMAECAKGVSPLRLSTGIPGVFPDLRRPRVVWLGITGDLPRLIDLQQNLDAGLAVLGNGRFKPEDRPFKGHLTLGRIKDKQNQDILIKALKAAGQIASQTFTADAVHLIQSRLTPSGAIYTPLRRVVLNNSVVIVNCGN
jgi:2'-5' RNA ligase